MSHGTLSITGLVEDVVVDEGRNAKRGRPPEPLGLPLRSRPAWQTHQEEDEKPRPEFAANAPYLEENPITGVTHIIKYPLVDLLGS